MKIAFYTPHLTFRGSCVAIYDYAHYSEILYGHTCIIATPTIHHQSTRDNNIGAFRWLSMRFPILFIDSLDELDNSDVDLIYIIKHGQRDDVVFTKKPFVVHCVFDMSFPHGSAYSAVSESLARKFSSDSFVPHIVSMNTYWTLPNLRKPLGIPKDAIVFGRYGGMDTFNLQFAKKIISRIVRENSKVYFLLMNTPKWDNHPQIIHLSPISNQGFKKRFIASCNAMIVPETLGHTFGLAIAEFQTFDKPIICFNGHVWNTAHLDILGDNGVYFQTEDELYARLTEFVPFTSPNCYRPFHYTRVMAKFNTEFLEISQN